MLMMCLIYVDILTLSSLTLLIGIRAGIFLKMNYSVEYLDTVFR